MEQCTRALSSSWRQSFSSLVFCSEVQRDGLGGWSRLSPKPARSQIVDYNRGSSVVDFLSVSRRRRGSIFVAGKFKFNAAVGDGARPLSDDTEGEQTINGHLPRKDGLLQWFKNAVATRSAQKEEMVNNLKRYGVAGVLSYGLLNTAYYLVTFLFVWFYVAPSPGGLGFVPAAQRFLKVFATVWAGSQVTKLLRAGGALSLAPVVDRGLNWYTQRFNFKSRANAFSFLVGACFGLAALVFLVITTLWS